MKSAAVKEFREWTLIFDHDNQVGDIRSRGTYTKNDRHDEHVDVVEASAIEAERARSEKLVEALKFYRDEFNWIQGFHEACSAAIADTGTRAKKHSTSIQKRTEAGNEMIKVQIAALDKCLKIIEPLNPFEQKAVVIALLILFNIDDAPIKLPKVMITSEQKETK